MEAFKEYVEETYIDANIIHINFILTKYGACKEYHVLNDYIADALTNNKDKINHKTVGSYLEYLCNAFAFYRFRRYDIQGKKYLASNDKLYLSDHTFRYAKLGTPNLDVGRVLENIVAIELLRRGYEVYVGVLYKKEIDFVALKRSEKIYIQVYDNISDEKTFKCEAESLLQIKDAYPKMIIARTRNGRNGGSEQLLLLMKSLEMRKNENKRRSSRIWIVISGYLSGCAI